MKKTYFAPQVTITELELQSMVCTSPGVGGTGGAGEPGGDIGYGGVDDGGTKDPASRRRSAWGD